MTRRHDRTIAVLTAARGLPLSPMQLIVGGIVLGVVGLAMVRASESQSRRPRRGTVKLGAGLLGPLAATAVTARVITGVQWAVVSHTGTTAVWAVASGLPAILAGATVTRLLLLARLAHRQRRRTCSVGTERGGRR
jgi:hypothetical protein